MAEKGRNPDITICGRAILQAAATKDSSSSSSSSSSSRLSAKAAACQQQQVSYWADGLSSRCSTSVCRLGTGVLFIRRSSIMTPAPNPSIVHVPGRADPAVATEGRRPEQDHMLQVDPVPKYYSFSEFGLQWAASVSERMMDEHESTTISSPNWLGPPRFCC